MQQRSDEQLALLALNGDAAAFEILVIRYQKQIFALAYRLGGDYDEAKDMAQEAFFRIYQELTRFDSSRRFFPWMYKVAYNTCVNQLHKRPKVSTPLESIGEAESAGDPEGDPSAAFVQLEQSEMLQSALKDLPEHYRIPLVLKYLEGMSYQEISEFLDLPVTTIETRLFRGRNMLKEKLAAYIKTR